jgi:hypothetical protein
MSFKNNFSIGVGIVGFVFCLISAELCVFAKNYSRIQYADLDEDKGIFYSETSNPEEWKKWFKDRKEYIQKTRTLFKKAVEVENSFYGTAKNYSASSSYTYLMSESQGAVLKISNIMNDIVGITPSQEMGFYHERLIASCEYMMKAIEAYAEEGVLYASYKITSITLAMDAVDSLKNLYNEHGASQEESDDLNHIIEEGLLAKN